MSDEEPRFVLRSTSGRYVLGVQTLGMMYGPRERAAELSQSQVEHFRKFLPDGPDLIVEPVPVSDDETDGR